MFNLGNNEFHGSMTIYPIAADLHHDTDEFSKMDPYVIFIIGTQHHKTNVCKHGGKKPHWSDCVSFNCSTKDSIFIEVKDHNTFSSDTVIAAAELKVSQLVEKNCAMDDWITVFYKHKACGTLHLKATYVSNELNTFLMGGNNVQMNVNVMGNQQQFNMNNLQNQNQMGMNINMNMGGNQFQQQQQFNMNTNFNQNQMQFQNMNSYNTMNNNNTIQETIKVNQFGQEEIILKEGHKHHHHQNQFVDPFMNQQTVQETVKFDQFGNEKVTIKETGGFNNYGNYGNNQIKETIKMNQFGQEEIIIKEGHHHHHNSGGFGMGGNVQVKEEVFINPNGTETVVIEEKHKKHHHHNNW